jgi:hypothetical protein
MLNWIELHVRPLLVGAAFGGMLTQWAHPAGWFWAVGAVAGMGIAVAIWQAYDLDWRLERLPAAAGGTPSGFPTAHQL